MQEMRNAGRQVLQKAGKLAFRSKCPRLGVVAPDGLADMMMYDIIRPKGSVGHQKLHARLQKLPGVGVKGAKAVRLWLDEIGCKIDPQ